MVIQKKYVNDNLTTKHDSNTFYQQKIDPNYRYTKVSYNHPPESSYKVNKPVSFNNISDQPYQHSVIEDNVETVTTTYPKVSRVINTTSTNPYSSTRSSNLESSNYHHQEISNPIFKSSLTNMKDSNIEEKSSTKDNMKESNDPNTIKINNNNGPETFTITHKTYKI